MGKNRISAARCVDRPVSFDLPAFVAELGACFKFCPTWEGRGVSFGMPSSDHSFEEWLRRHHDLGVTDDEVSVSLLHYSLLSKFSDGNVQDSEKRHSAAIRKWIAAEEQCLATNQRILSRDSSEWKSVQPIVFMAARKISQVLGEFDWNEVSNGFGFGPGATCRLGRRHKALAQKFSGKPETTLDNLALAIAAIKAVPRWYETSFDDVSGSCVSIRNFNKIVTVPKNSKTDRVISIEPDMNIYIQKGLGRVIRNRLLRVGIDLNRQENNQFLAKIGSESGSLATIDLSSASDTVAHALVWELLPEPWFTALEQCRTPSGVLPSGELIQYQKFSSMGNGFTFELESLIFWALAQATVDSLDLKGASTVSVFGDDIILDVAAVPKFLDVLRICGFTPNSAKSWWETPYRESCGKHYFHGVDVTPFFHRSTIRRCSDLFLLHNNLYRWLSRNLLNRLVDHKKVYSLLSKLRDLAPSKWKKPRIPDEMGDGAFIGSFDQCTPRRARRGWDGFEIDVMIDIPHIYDKTGYGCVLAFLSKRGDIVYDPLSPKLQSTYLPEPWVGMKTLSRKEVGTIFLSRSVRWPVGQELVDPIHLNWDLVPFSW